MANITTNPLNLVRIVNTSQFSPSSPDPSGIVYISHLNSLMISDAEVDEMPALFTGKNLFNVSLTGSLLSTFTAIGFSKETPGIGYNPTNKHLYITDDDHLKVFDLNPGADGKYNTADDSVTSFDTLYSGPTTDPEDIAYSPTTGDLFIIDGLNTQVYRVSTTGKLLSQFDTQSIGILDPEGIAVGPNGNLFIVGNPATNNNAVYEVTPTGTIIGRFDISAAKPVKPAGLTFAPSSNNSNNLSLYIVDRGVDNNIDPNENDGRLYEFSFGSSTIPSPGVLAFSAPTFSINENGTAIAKVQVTRTGGSNGAVDAAINLTNGTATAPADYNGTPIVVTFANGDSATKTITIPIVDDTLAEGNETINLSLANPGGGAVIGTQSNAVLTVVDNDSAIAFSAPDFSIREDGTAVASVQVIRTGSSSGAIGATINFVDGSAKAPTDYSNSPIKVSFAAGDTTPKTITIPIVDDTSAEGNETLTLSLGSPTGGALIGNQATASLTILDNDIATPTPTPTPTPIVTPTPTPVPLTTPNVINGTDASETLIGTSNQDIINAAGGNDILIGLDEKDILNGDAGNDKAFGNAGDDILNGGVGNDTLYGELGNDQLNGGAGKDTLVGGLGKDILAGGAGKDKFVYKSIKDGVDLIKDFNVKQDVIVLKGLFKKGFKRSHLFGEYVKLSRSGSNTVVKVDIDGLGGKNHFTSLAVLENVKPSSLTGKNFLV